MNVCLVGNGHSEEWHWTRAKHPNSSEFIDSCDVVVRMNWCPYYLKGWTGFKADVLLLRPASDKGHGSQIAAQYDMTIPSEVTRQVGRVYIVRGIDNMDDEFDEAAGPYLTRYGWDAERVELLPHAYKEKARAVCGAADKFSMITIGTVGIYLMIEKYPDAEIYLAGYYFAGAAIQDTQMTHDWTAERDWVMGLAERGRVVLLP